MVGDVQAELNAVFTLDSRLGGDTPDDDAADPVQISVAAPDADDDATDDATGGTTDDAADRRRPDADTA